MQPPQAQGQLLSSSRQSAPSPAPHLSPASHTPNSQPYWLLSSILSNANHRSATPPLWAPTPRCVLKLLGVAQGRGWASVQAAPSLKLLYPSYRLQLKGLSHPSRDPQLQPLSSGLECVGQSWKEAGETWRTEAPRKRTMSSRWGR